MNLIISSLRLLQVLTWKGINCSSSNNIEEIIEKYESHPSVQKIKESIQVTNKFVFNDTTSQYFRDEIGQLDPTKASIRNDIPAKILIKSNEVVASYLANIYTNSKNEQIYPTSLKIADVVPIHKKDEKTAIKNYRSVSLIQIFSKLFERNMYDQIIVYIDKLLSTVGKYKYRLRQFLKLGRRCIIVRGRN